MPDPLLWTIQALLALIFGWAAGAKVLQWSSWRSSLKAYGIPTVLERPASVAVPLAEASIAGLILGGVTRVGMASALALLAAFSLAVVRARAREGDRLPCGCFGRTEARDYRLMLVRNALIGSLAGVVLVAGDDKSPMSAAEIPPAGDVLPALLVAAGVVLAVWMLKHIMQLMRRREHM